MSGCDIYKSVVYHPQKVLLRGKINFNTYICCWVVFTGIAANVSLKVSYGVSGIIEKNHRIWF